MYTHLVEASVGDTTVGRVAYEHGFHHLFRFARDYRRIYGEAPSATLKRSPA